MWLLILMFLTTPVIAQEYKKLDDNTIEIKQQTVEYIDVSDAWAKIARLEEAKKNAGEPYQIEIDKIKQAFDEVGISLEPVEEVVFPNPNEIVLPTSVTKHEI